MTESFDNLLDETQKNVHLLSMYPTMFEKEELRHLHPFMDKALFNSLCLLDTLISLRHLNASIENDNRVQANYFARIASLHVKESLDNLNHFHGKDFRESVADLLDAESLAEIDAAVKGLNSLKKRCFPMLTEIRHNVIAHKDPNGIEQLRVIRLVDATKVKEIGWEAVNFHVRLLGEYVRLVGNLA